jgi:hypothetical protein
MSIFTNQFKIRHLFFFKIAFINTFIVGIYRFQEHFIFVNSVKLAQNFEFKFSNNFEEFFLKTADGNFINAVHFKLKNPKGIVLFCHGNTGNLKDWVM